MVSPDFPHEGREEPRRKLNNQWKRQVGWRSFAAHAVFLNISPQRAQRTQRFTKKVYLIIKFVHIFVLLRELRGKGILVFSCSTSNKHLQSYIADVTALKRQRRCLCFLDLCREAWDVNE
jgi:hypothetical protein